MPKRDNSRRSQTTQPGALYAGTSGLVLPVPNKLAYPEAYRDKSRLCFYGSLFNSVEVNSSFYKVPMSKTVARWAESVPDGFQFTFKLHKAITHNKPLKFDAGEVARFMQIIDHAGDRKGCLLVQFPAGTQASFLDTLKHLVHTIRERDPKQTWKVSLEFRHLSWYTEEVYGLLHSLHMNVVMHDIAPYPPRIDSFGGWTYLRFHGPEKNYRGSYALSFLQQRATEIRALMKAGTTVYVYFNNTLGDAINNLQTLRELCLRGKIH